MNRKHNKNRLHLLPTIKTSWQQSKRNKSALWVLFIFLILINFMVKYALATTYNAFAHTPLNFNSVIPLHLLIVYQLTASFFSTPFYAAMLANAIKISRRQRVSINSGFNTLKRFPTLAMAGLVIAVLTSSASITTSILFQYQGVHRIYLPIASTLLFPFFILSFLPLTLPLIIDNNQTILRSLWQSFSIMIRHFNWLKLLLCYGFSLVLLSSLIAGTGWALWFNQPLLMMVSSCALALLITWLVPFLAVLNAGIYTALKPVN